MHANASITGSRDRFPTIRIWNGCFRMRPSMQTNWAPPRSWSDFVVRFAARSPAGRANISTRSIKCLKTWSRDAASCNYACRSTRNRQNSTLPFCWPCTRWTFCAVGVTRWRYETTARPRPDAWRLGPAWPPQRSWSVQGRVENGIRCRDHPAGTGAWCQAAWGEERSRRHSRRHRRMASPHRL